MNKKTFIYPIGLTVITLFGIFLFISQQNNQTTQIQKDLQKLAQLDFVGADKLKLGLRELMLEYETKGVEAALLYAQEDLGLDCQKEKCYVHILTKGNVSDEFIDDFEKIGINGMNTSSLNNLVEGYLSFEEIKLLTSQDFVYSVSTPPTVIAE